MKQVRQDLCQKADSAVMNYVQLQPAPPTGGVAGFSTNDTDRVGKMHAD